MLYNRCRVIVFLCLFHPYLVSVHFLHPYIFTIFRENFLLLVIIMFGIHNFNSIIFVLFYKEIPVPQIEFTMFHKVLCCHIRPRGPQHWGISYTAEGIVGNNSWNIGILDDRMDSGIFRKI